LPSERRKKGDYLHDGFYARLALGPAYSWGSGEARPVEFGLESSGSRTLDFSGWGPSLSVFLGGTLPGGVALGAAFVTTLASEPTYETARGQRKGGTVSQGFLGLVLDWYFDPKEGFHALAIAGLGGMSFDADDSIPSESLQSSGAGVAFGGGYDWFVGRNISFGLLPLIQFNRAGFTYGNEGTVDGMAVAVLLTAVAN
jgi:opacity protein-like surface antigen